MANIEAERRWMAERSREGQEAERRRWAAELAQAKVEHAAAMAEPCDWCGHLMGDHVLFYGWCQVNGCTDTRCRQPEPGVAYALAF